MIVGGTRTSYTENYKGDVYKMSKFLEGLNPSQAKATQTIEGNIQINAVAGSGKCITGDSLILTNKGIVAIQDIPSVYKEHEEAVVKSIDLENLEMVQDTTSHWYNMGESNTIKIVTSQGYTLEGTPEHPIVVMEGENLRFKKLQDITKEDIVAISLNNNLWGTNNLVSKDLSLFIGLLLGDGYLCSTDSKISFAKVDSEFSSKYIRLVKHLFGDVKVNEERHSKCNSISWTLCNKDIKKYLKDTIGLEMVGACYKSIPNSIMTAPKEVVIRCLQGLFDTDGTVNVARSSIEYSTNSAKLAHQIQMCLLNLGINCRLKNRPNKFGNHYYIYIGGSALRTFRKEIGFNLATSKQQKLLEVCEKKCNDNARLIPNQQDRLQRLLIELEGKPYMKGKSRLYTASGVIMYLDYCKGRKKLTTNTCSTLLDTIDFESEDTKALSLLNSMLLDTIDTISEGRQVVYDFTVPRTHSFVSNGIISHNTRVLTHRVAYMLEQGIKPNSILLTTFTKKATTEMTDRLSRLIPKMKLSMITIGTSHSIGYRILKKEYEAMGNPLVSAFKRRDGVLTNGVLKRYAEDIKQEIIRDRTIDFEVKNELKNITVPQLLKVVGLSKNNGIDDEEYELLNVGQSARTDAYVEFFKRYEHHKKRDLKIDSDDMLFLLWRLLKENKEVLQKYQSIYKYIMVDESQDNNSIQYEIFSMLALPEGNLFIVGDDDQCMYSFRGANPEEFIFFKNHHPNVIQISLEDNYRSNPGILQVANKLIRNNKKRIMKTLKPHKEGSQECVFYSDYSDEEEEAIGVIKDIEVLVQKEKLAYKDITILFRTNAQTRALEDRLIASGLPYVIHGGISFYERKEVKDIVSYLQLAIDPNNDTAFKRVINTPSRFLGKAFMEKVKGYKGSHWEAINNLTGLKDYERNGIQKFMNLVEELQNLKKQEVDLEELVDHILEEGGYKEYILGEEEEEESSRMENIDTLKFVLGKYENVEDFLNYITLMTSSAKLDIDGIQLMTIHKSKGLEFPVSFVVGVGDGVLPHFKSIEEGKVEEERRLCYVGITRAESQVYISSVQSFNGKKCTGKTFVTEMGLIQEDKEDIESKVVNS